MKILFIIFNIYLINAAKADVSILSVGPHHHAVGLILKAQIQNKNLKDLPILHMDSHPDMGFSPTHFLHQDKALAAKDMINSATPEMIDSFQDSLTDVSQVIIPLAVSGLSKEFYMCMPPWYLRTKLENKLAIFQIQLFNKAQFINAKTHRYLPITNEKQFDLASPFILKEKLPKGEKMQMTFFNCYTQHPRINSDYILSLDLDIISTNGDYHNIARPISNLRENKNPNVSKEEWRAVKYRVGFIMKLLRKLKKSGYLPRVIVIADSAGKKGGGFTPPPIARYASQFLKRELKLLVAK